MSRNFELYDLRITVTAIEGRSVCGMQVGDYFELVESSKLRIPPDRYFCVYALSAALPLLAGFTLAIIEIGAVDAVRFAVFHTWSGLPLLN